MKRFLVLFLVSLMVVVPCFNLAGISSAKAEESNLDRIIDKGKITIAVFSDVVPFGYTDEKNELTGIDVDVARGIAEALGVEVEFVPTTNANRIPYLLSEKVDVVVAAFSMNAERRVVVEYSDPYFRGGAVLVLKKDNAKTAGVSSITDLSGLRISVSKGSLNDELATKLAGDKNEILRFDNVSDVYQALIDDKADALVEDVVLAGYNIKTQYQGLTTAGELLSVDAVGIGIRRGDQIFLNWLDGYVFDLLSSGKMADICAKYGVDYNPVNYVY